MSVNGVHQSVIDMAMHHLDNAKQGKVQADSVFQFKDFINYNSSDSGINDALEYYDLAKGARKYADENHSSVLTWPEDEHGMVKSYLSYPGGQTDVITDNIQGGAFRALTINYNGDFDYTPNSIKLQYYNPSCEYTFDNNGNCTNIVQSSNGKAETEESYAYDEANQLVYREVDEGADGVIDKQQYFTYCEYGDLKTRTTVEGDTTYYEEFDENGRVVYARREHENSDIMPPVESWYSYDCSGRLRYFEEKSEFMHNEYDFIYNDQGNLSCVQYDNKYNETFWGFLMNLFKEQNKDETIYLE